MTKPPLIKLIVAEDHELARYGLVRAFEAHEQYCVVAEAANGSDTVNLALKHQPDAILMDIGMPIMNGIIATQLIKGQSPKIKVLMLTSRDKREEVYASLAAGADAYCMKDIKIEQLCQVLDLVLEGGLWIDPAIASLLVAILPSHSHDVQVTEDVSPSSTSRTKYNAKLTVRERQVLLLIVEGKSNKGIAQALNVTSHTAKAHVCSIIQKLAVDDRTQAAVKALKEGLL